MKRRVIQIADSTQLISLPRKWAVGQGIKKGDELEIQEQGNKIVISSKKDMGIQSFELNPPHLPNITERYITSLYRGGCHEIKVNYSSKDNPDLVNFVSKKMDDQTIGYEIVTQENNNFIIRDLSGTSESGFDTALKRTFVLFTTMVSDISAAFRNNDKSGLQNMYVVDRSINKFTNFCARELILKGQKDIRKTSFYYHFLRAFESLADQFSLLATHCAGQDKPLPKQALGIYEEIKGIMSSFQDVFYDFSREKVSQLYKSIKRLSPENLSKIKDIDPVVLSYLLSIQIRSKELLDCIIDLNV